MISIFRRVLITLSLFFASLFFIFLAFGQTPDEIRQKIENRQKDIEQLEAEIASFQKELDNTAKEKDTLQNALKTLDLTRKKLLADISLTEKKISITESELKRLSRDIGETQKDIGIQKEAVVEGIKIVNESDNNTFMEILLRNENLSLLWDDLENMRKIQNGLRERERVLTALKNDLEGVQRETTKRKADLIRFRGTLSDQRKIVEQNQTEKNRLLKETQNKESSYKKFLAEKEALRSEFEQELIRFESELKFALDLSKLPNIGSGVLSWPLDNVYITQYFGNTEFAKSGAYNGQGHNGIDFKATIGTPIKSSGNGIVKGTGDTDLVCPGASYGKWVLVEHGNGLSTLYAHLSLIKVAEGQNILSGEMLGYSGATGYVTGPHLHFSVYASSAVSVINFPSRVCKGEYRMPVANLKAYLNPIDFLRRI